MRITTKRLFTPRAYQRLIRCAVQGGATREEISWFIAQCEAIRVKSDMLRVLLSGEACVSDITKETFAVRIPPP
jgi:hypothetical protein